MTDFSALIARLEAGSGEDRELDGELMFTAFAKPAGPTGYLWPEDNPSWNFAMRFPGKDRAWFDKCRGADRETIVIWRDGDPILMNSMRVRPLTGSLDAALAFAEAAGVRWHDALAWGMTALLKATAGNALPHREQLPRHVIAATLKALEAKAHG